MLTFIPQSLYVIGICFIISGCSMYDGHRSFYVQNNSNNTLIKSNDIIVIIPNIDNKNYLPITQSENSNFKVAKPYLERKLNDLGYHTIGTSQSAKATLIALLSLKIDSHEYEATRQSCVPIFDMDKDGKMVENQQCTNETYTAIAYIYTYSLEIYRPNTPYIPILPCPTKQTNLCITPLVLNPQNMIFSSYIRSDNVAGYQVGSSVFNDMTNAVFSTFPLNRDTIVTLKNTTQGNIPVSVKFVD